MNELRDKILTALDRQIDEHIKFVRNEEHDWDTTKDADAILDAVIEALPNTDTTISGDEQPLSTSQARYRNRVLAALHAAKSPDRDQVKEGIDE